jgi:hypothetical protein
LPISLELLNSDKQLPSGHGSIGKD